jgi:hypothetical protein
MPVSSGNKTLIKEYFFGRKALPCSHWTGFKEGTIKLTTFADLAELELRPVCRYVVPLPCTPATHQ